MKKLHTPACALVLLFNICCGQHPVKKAGQDQSFAYTNALIHESSPYLLQHAHNPVDWYPWGYAALEKARAENKMLLISIGYAACHWCHVMEHACFEDTAVARIMNDYFICIKVDREERPDVDQVYMTAAELMNGGGGWPLNTLALSNGKPFYAGTYFPKKDWIRMLDYFINLNAKDHEAIVKRADEIARGLQTTDGLSFSTNRQPYTLADLAREFDNLEAGLDVNNGGIGRAPKFPMPSVWQYLLHYYYLSGNRRALDAVNLTLRHMAGGGIYDQLGGGFARYATDAAWRIPHFEKMLYDNAQLVELYAEAFEVTGDARYKSVVYETLGMIERDFTSPEGGFYSSLDADSEGEEGRFYAWKKNEIDQVLGPDAALFCSYFGVTPAGNWENGNNILYRNSTGDSLAVKYHISRPELENRIDSSKTLLLRVRNQRVKPGLDDKILTSWNAMMLKAYARAYRVFGGERFLSAALKNADFLVSRAMKPDGELNRNYRKGKSSIPGMLDDYAFSISAFIELYQATYEEKWLERARKITDYAIRNFLDTASGMFFYTGRHYSGLIARKMEISDNVIPSSNSEMARNLFVLGNYYSQADYAARAAQMLNNVGPQLERNITFFSNWGRLAELYAAPLFEVAIVGNDFNQRRREMDGHYLPNVIMMGGSSEGSLELLENKLVQGQTTIYVCSNKVCKFPVTATSQALGLIKNDGRPLGKPANHFHSPY